MDAEPLARGRGLDTLKHAEALRAQGFDLAAAHAVARVMGNAMADAATKDDIKEIEAYIQAAEMRIITRLGVMVASAAVIVIGAVGAIIALAG